MAQAIALVAGLTDRFTAVPKTHDLVALGISPAAISTYNALADHANNLTGECYPMMKSLARLLNRAEKTIQRHIDELIEAGIVEKIKRRRDKKGRFLGWRFRLPHLAAAAKRIKDRRKKNREAYEERKKQQEAKRKARSKERRRYRLSKGTGTAGFASEEATYATDAELAPEAEQQRKREKARKRRWRDYEWFFDPSPQERRDPEEGDETPSSGLFENPLEGSNGREQADS